MISSSWESEVGPTRRRTPSYVRTSSSRTLSTVRPARTECTPQELLPIIPPRLQYSCVEGSGPKVRSNWLARLRRWSSTTPDCTHAYFCSALNSRIWLRYLEKSMTTATLQHCPARLVPPPLAKIGAP